MLFQPFQRWNSALQDKSFRSKFIITGILLGLCAIIAPAIFKFIQQRNGPILNDYILNWLPATDLSFWIFLVLYVLILSGAVILFQEPERFLHGILAYLIITLLRFITLLLVPLDPPTNIIELRDPLVQYLFYQQSITKDLFFSGHTSVVILLGLVMPNPRLRGLYFTSAGVVAFMLLLQHAHYTIDIFAAPFFAWLSVWIAHLILKPTQSAT